MASCPLAIYRIQWVGMDIRDLGPVRRVMAQIASIRGQGMTRPFSFGACAIVTINTVVQRLIMIDLR
jgi:hypothetical protein